jgi:hypothetical protein
VKKKEQSYMNEFAEVTCPKCGGETNRYDLSKHHFIACDVCRIYWYYGYGIFTSYAQMVHAGALDDDIGGYEKREVAIFDHDRDVMAVLDSYKPWWGGEHWTSVEKIKKLLGKDEGHHVA